VEGRVSVIYHFHDHIDVLVIQQFFFICCEKRGRGISFFAVV